MFSSKSVIVSGLIFMSLTRFELIFVCGVRKWSNFILLHIAVQFSQQLIEGPVFDPLYILVPLPKIKSDTVSPSISHEVMGPDAIGNYKQSEKTTLKLRE